MKRSFKWNKGQRNALIGLIITAAASIATAGPVYTTELPATKLTVRDALKQAKSGKVVFKCQRATITEAGGVGKAKRAKTVFVADVKDNEAALDTIQDGGKGFKCQPLEWDAERKKLVNSDQDASDES